MSEKRQHRRHRKRHNVRFGDTGFTYSGLTYDVSSTGMFLVTNQLMPIKSRLHVQMFLDTSRFICMEAEVRRHKLVPANLRQVEKGGMGLRLLSPAELMRDLVDEGRLRVTVTYPSAVAFQAAYTRDLARNTMLLKTGRPLALDTKLVIEMVLPFVPASVELEASVGPNPPGTPEGTIAIVFDPPGCAAVLAPYLG